VADSEEKKANPRLKRFSTFGIWPSKATWQIRYFIFVVEIYFFGNFENISNSEGLKNLHI